MKLIELCAGLKLLGEPAPEVPLLHLVLDPPPETNGKQQGEVLQDIADAALDLGLLVAVHRISPLDRWQPQPSLRCPCASAAVCMDII